MTKGLSKSRYTAFCQCPKNLWLKMYKPDEATVDASVEARFEQGNEVGDLAMGLFGPFVEVTTQRADGSLNLTAMVEKTKEEMTKGTDVICEASFTFERNYCAVDILRKTKKGWAIYEVKSSSFPEFDGQEAKLEKYAPDIAYQKWVLTRLWQSPHHEKHSGGALRQGADSPPRAFLRTSTSLSAGLFGCVPQRVSSCRCCSADGCVIIDIVM